jgi:hypothetical protein
MPTFRTSLTNLSNLTVTGVAHNYDVDEVPENVTRSQLPALCVLPLDIQDVRQFRERGEGFQTVAFSGGAKTITYSVTHLLLVAPVTSGNSLRRQLPTLVDLMDNYFAALKNDVTLSGTLLEPAHVNVEPGMFAHGEGKFYGCAFRHVWLMEI